MSQCLLVAIERLGADKPATQMKKKVEELTRAHRIRNDNVDPKPQLGEDHSREHTGEDLISVCYGIYSNAPFDLNMKQIFRSGGGATP
jgi:hypothetical protein